MRPSISQQNSVQLNQIRPATTNAQVLSTPIDKGKYLVYHIMIANTTGSDVLASVFHDNDGSVFNQTTALWYQVSVPANDTTIIEFRHAIPLLSPGNLGGQSSVANALTFTVYGVILNESGV